MENKTLVLEYYADIKDAPLYELFRQADIKTQNKLIVLSYYSWQDFLETGISTVSYIIFY